MGCPSLYVLAKRSTRGSTRETGTRYAHGSSLLLLVLSGTHDLLMEPRATAAPGRLSSQVHPSSGSSKVDQFSFPCCDSRCATLSLCTTLSCCRSLAATRPLPRVDADTFIQPAQCSFRVITNWIAKAIDMWSSCEVLRYRCCLLAGRSSLIGTVYPAL